jgi:hypothetical protein
MSISEKDPDDTSPLLFRIIEYANKEGSTSAASSCLNAFNTLRTKSDLSILFL